MGADRRAYHRAREAGEWRGVPTRKKAIKKSLIDLNCGGLALEWDKRLNLAECEASLKRP
jgi:hypothetical protein